MSVEAFVRKLYGQEVKVRLAKQGSQSTTFFFDVLEGPRCMQLNKTRAGFDRSAYVAALLAAHGIATPRMLKIGQWVSEDPLPRRYFAISERIEGHDLGTGRASDIISALPKVMSVLEKVHAVEGQEAGWGLLNNDGKGESANWKDAIESFNRSKAYDGDIGDLSFEKTIVSKAMAMFTGTVSKACLVHGDFSPQNIVKAGDSVCFVDWAVAKWGDHLFDIARLNYWLPTGKNGPLLDYLHEQTLNYTKGMLQRYNCYILLWGLKTLRHFAWLRHVPQYRATASLVRSFLHKDSLGN